MTMTTGREFGVTRAPGGLPFAYVPAKVVVPSPRPGSLHRGPVINRLRGAQSVPVITMLAPAGSGKTTILAQWADRDDRPFAWVSIDERDNDPLVLVRHVAAALDRIAPLNPVLLNALRSRSRSLWTAAVPRLAAALASLESPCVIVLDNASLLDSEDSLEVVATLAEHIATRSTLVLSGRTPVALPIAALRARGLLFEVGPELVSLSKREGETLLRGTNVGIDEEQASELIDRSEGWAAGLYLAALAIRDGSGPDCERPSGDDRYLAEYFRSECLAAHSPQQLAFLRRTSILESLSAPICDAVLARRDSARELAAIGASNLFVVPLDRSGKSYRYHRLFRDLLRSELEREEPELVAPLHRLAADWFEANDDPASAIAHATAAGDMDRAARLISSLGIAVCDAGRIAAVERWLHHFDTASLERHPEVAVIGAWVHARRGRRAEANGWLEIAAGHPELGGCIAVVRAAMCEDGVETMLADAEIALSALPAESSWRPIALLLRGVALTLLDEPDAADTSLGLAEGTGELRGATDTRIAALSERALIAAARGDHGSFEQFTHDARRLASTIEPQSSTTGVLQPAEFARLLLRRARWGEARAELTSARRQATVQPAPFPWLAAQTHLELARAFMTLRDVGAAQLELDEAADILRGRRDLGILHAQAHHLQSELDTVRDLRPGVEFRLTPAELRLIPLLASHLTFPKIAERFCLSRNTVKTQAISVYRKLGVSSRGDAIEQALRLGLLAADVDAGADELEGAERALVA